MKRLFLISLLLLTAACGAAETPIPIEAVPNPPISTPSQVTLLLSDPFTDENVSMTFDLPENWPITAGLSNTRIIVIPTLKPLSPDDPSPVESVSRAVGKEGDAAERLTVNGREVFVAVGGELPNALMSFAVVVPDRSYFLQINVTQVFEGSPEEYREALQRIIASARLSE
ncbi:MAG: hypothetical protein SNJ58_10360 [Aggregatilineales bacterium]